MCDPPTSTSVQLYAKTKLITKVQGGSVRASFIRVSVDDNSLVYKTMFLLDLAEHFSVWKEDCAETLQKKSISYVPILVLMIKKNLKKTHHYRSRRPGYDGKGQINKKMFHLLLPTKGRMFITRIVLPECLFRWNKLRLEGMTQREGTKSVFTTAILEE